MSPLLTPSQFAKTAAAKKPGATWQGYKSWVLKTRAKRAVARTADPLSGILQSFQASLLTPAQQAASARTSVNTQIAAEQAANRASTAAAQLQANNQAKRAEGFAFALANLTKPRADQVAGQYREAADRIRAYGTGLTGAAGESFQQSADQAAQHLAGTGAPVAGPTGSYDPSGLKNTMQYLGTTLPGVSLEEQAANAATQAALARQSSVASIGDIAQQYRQKTTDLQSDLATKMQALQATRPDLYQKALTAAQSGNTQNMATLVTALTLQNTQGKTAADIVNEGTKTGVTVAKAYGQDANGNVLPGFYPQTDPKTGKTRVNKVPAGWVYDWGKGKLVRKSAAPAGKGAAGKGKLTPAQVKAYIGKQATAIGKAASAPPYTTWVPGGAVGQMIPPTPGKQFAGPGGYQKAFNQLLHGYFDKKYWTNPQAIQAVQDALARSGYQRPTKPVKNPRPPIHARGPVGTGK